MKSFRDLPIQRKMLLMTLLICGAVLCVAIVALFTFQVLNFRSNFQRDTATLAAIIANNSTAALAFKDAKGGAEVVGSLQARPTVVAASLFLPDGSLFAQFGKKEDARTLSQFPPAGESQFTGKYLLHTQPVVLDKKQVGTLYLRSDFQKTFQELLRLYALVIAGVMIVSIGLAVLLSGRLQRIITDPVLKLADAARIVGETKDYSLRVAGTSRGDELGRLTGAFNEMLAKVEGRTAALQQANQALELEIAERKRMEAELAYERDLLKTLLENVPDAIYFKDLESRFVRYSQSLTRVCHQDDPEALKGKTDAELFAEEHARAAREDEQEIIRTGKPILGKIEKETRTDGRVSWALTSKTPWRDKDGNVIGTFGISKDITSIKNAEQQVEKLHRDLLATSRQAGMAEVATGVLHNVGNVLNSVSVSATLVSDRLRCSKSVNLRRATTMLREQNGHLVEFLTTDPKGKLLPDYLGTVADQLATEQTELIQEMNSLGRHIEHIKEIVAMQQSYAKVSGAYENLPAAGLVEDALRMNSAAFERHRIQVVREFDQNAPPVCVDRHKVLQILINLVRNAKYAMDAQNTHDNQLVIRVRQASPDRVKITVSDNGVGIAPDSLIKIFGHGFTTKKDGHGFGLHSGANAAKEMGGSLTAHSDGVGQGATFDLELPVAASTREREITSKQGTL